MESHTIQFHQRRPSAPSIADATVAPIVGSRVELQLLTTLRCNLKCTYCSIAEGDVRDSQGDVTYSFDELERFVDTHLKGYDVYVTFYGGEPTLNLDFMTAVMQRFPLFRYQLQTNGTLLDDVPEAILARLSNILVSIDGGERITDGYRGRGIYRQVLKNVDKIRDKLAGTLTARVTWSDAGTTFEELDALAGSFDYVYFQFVAGKAYEPESMAVRREVLRRLIERFFAGDAALYPVIPLMGVVRNKLFPERAKELYAGMTQCRVSTHILNVMPDGKIYPCPDMMHLPEMLQGDLRENWLSRSPLQPHPAMPCESCEAFDFCRRNCMKNLYLAYVKGQEEYRINVTDPICDLIRFIGQEVDRYDLNGWYGALALPAQKELRDAEVYEYVEIMP
ncbi:MAG: radical SAM protein [Burkholderiales bacterium]|nr:radical SAM protein [Burkholderiales bacterium]